MLSSINYPTAKSQYAALLAALLLLPGCSSLQQPEPPLEPPSPWGQFLDEQRRTTHWTLLGKLGIRSEKQNTSANLNWRQENQHYRLHLSGPLGQGAVLIEGQPGFIELALSEDERYVADSPETLLNDQLGWEIPLTNLPYWVRGIPAPDQVFTASFTPESRLKRLQQQGWVVEYSRYQVFDGSYLPQKLILNRPGIKVTLIIKRWESGS